MHAHSSNFVQILPTPSAVKKVKETRAAQKPIGGKDRQSLKRETKDTYVGTEDVNIAGGVSPEADWSWGHDDVAPAKDM